MSLKVIADACRIVDRGQDLALRGSNRPYSAEEDELVEARSSRPDRAANRRTSKLTHDITNSVSKVNALFSTFLSNYTGEYSICLDDGLCLCMRGSINYQNFDRAARYITSYPDTYFIFLQFYTNSTNIDKNTVEKLGFEPWTEDPDEVIIYYRFKLDSDLNSPAVERSFRNLGRYLQANDK